MKSSSFWLALPLALVLAGPAAVAQTSTTQTKAPEAGANSFTEGQAKSRIEGAGYTDVAALKSEGFNVLTRPAFNVMPLRASPCDA